MSSTVAVRLRSGLAVHLHSRVCFHASVHERENAREKKRQRTTMMK